MSDEIDVKIIKPPMDHVTSGRIFKPSKAYRTKLWLKAIDIGFIIWLIIVGGFYLGVKFMHIVEPQDYPSTQLIYAEWMGPIVNWATIITLLYSVPAMILIPFYVESLEYSVKGESGLAMPEIYVKKGIFTVRRNHVPFRTITNISSVAGPYDRILGIGNVHIETAGYSGQEQRGPEEKIEGIVFYEEVRDYILQELRKFREPYVTTTESPLSVEKRLGPEEVNMELLIILREIKEILENQ